MQESQTTNHVFVVRPCRFQSNPQTAESNAFQAQRPWQDLTESNRIAQAQFDGLVETLDRHLIGCIVFDDTPEPHTPDSIFPNNWISTHADGSVVLYPMEAPNRRTERREDVLQSLTDEHGFTINRTIDLSPYETSDRFLEGTGSLVLDRANRVAYACLSSRTEQSVIDEFCQQMGYAPIVFTSSDQSGLPIYHTNVMMCVGADFAVFCRESLPSHDQGRVMDVLAASGQRIIEIGFAELNAFAGNMLALQDKNGESVIALSAQAHAALSSRQRRALERHGALAICPIDHIETQSGGSVRCMLAEIHLPKA